MPSARSKRQKTLRKQKTPRYGVFFYAVLFFLVRLGSADFVVAVATEVDTALAVLAADVVGEHLRRVRPGLSRVDARLRRERVAHVRVEVEVEALLPRWYG